MFNSGGFNDGSVENTTSGPALSIPNREAAKEGDRYYDTDNNILYVACAMREDGGLDWLDISTSGSVSGGWAAAGGEITAIEEDSLVRIGPERTLNLVNSPLPTKGIHLASTGDAVLTLDADTNNSLTTEENNPKVMFIQDGGIVNAEIAICGNAGGNYTGSLQNAFYLQHNNNYGFQIAARGAAAVTVLSSPEASAGFVGIGTNAPGYTLDVAGDINYSGSISNVSDERLKKDIEDSALGVDFLNTLRPVSYKFREGDGKPHHGLIAQEVSQFSPEGFAAVSHDEVNDRYSLAYLELIAPLIKSVQELSARVVELESKLAGDQ